MSWLRLLLALAFGTNDITVFEKQFRFSGQDLLFGLGQALDLALLNQNRIKPFETSPYLKALNKRNLINNNHGQIFDII